MLKVRKSTERGRAHHGWLDARHTFSFANYYDPHHMGFRTLRVINQDIVSPGGGFAPHSHADMEIITYVLRGVIEHQDSMGNKARIKPGEIQVMSAGTGVTHSEYNPSGSEPLELLQIWILPDRRGYEPSYAQQAIKTNSDGGALQLIASPDGMDGSLPIHQDARLFVGRLREGESLDLDASRKRYYWLQVVKGDLEGKNSAETVALGAGDGLAMDDEEALRLTAATASEFLLFDMG